MKYLLSSLVFLLTFSAVLSQVTPAERAALIALYNSTDGANWANNTNWNTAATVDSWNGITVAGGHITEIELNGNNLIGPLPTEIGDLQHLQVFSLNRNRISGTIPEELYTILTLEEINLSANRDLAGGISTSVGSLVNLESYVLYENQMSGPIPLEITTLTNLETLSLYKNNFTGSILPELGNLTNLRMLQIGGNDYDIGTIPPELGNLVNLTTLWIDSSNLNGTLPPELGNLVELRSFYMHRNNLTGSIPDSYGNFTEAFWFLWGDNELTGAIPASLGNWTKCRFFLLNNNQLSGSIPPELGNMAAMDQLGLCNNQLTGAIPPELGNLSNLTQLCLSNNQLTGSIPASFTGLTNLYQLPISNNLMSGTIPDLTSLTTPGFDSKSLEFLQFDGNLFQFGDFENEFAVYVANMLTFDDNPQAKVNAIQNLNPALGSNVTLTTTVSGTQNHYQWYKDGMPIATAPDSPTFTITNIQATDSGVYTCEITSDIVTDLTLVRNDITLNITAGPSCDVTDRAALIAFYNATDGPNWIENTNWNTAAPLDTWFGVTTDASGCVTGIEMPRGTDGNDLSGILPVEIGDLKELRRLNLSFNGVGLNGTLPIELGLLIHLEAIILTGNGFTGDLIPEIITLSNLQQLYLGLNDLSGTIPIAITTMPSLELLQLNNNNFTGIIYPEYSNLVQLRELSIGGNQLTGTIPVSLGTFPNLERLELGFQNITGTIPTTLGNLTTLRSLNIRSAVLEGNIPNSLASLTNLEELFLDNNQLEGVIPDFTALTNLRLLFFGSNRFQFGDFETEFDNYVLNINSFLDNPQAKVDMIQMPLATIGDNITLTTITSGTANHYQWFKDGMPIVGGPDNASYTINNVQAADAGVYYAVITSDIVTDLTLVRNDITLTITCTPPIADDPADVTECSSYTLPPLNANNSYFTAPNGGGSMLNEGEIITSTQTIYVYTGTTGCSDENSFVVTISGNPTADILPNVTECDSFILPSLSMNNNYYTAPGGSGTQLNAGDEITATRILYIFTEFGSIPNSCSDESSFVITISESPIVDELSDVEECENYILPVLGNGAYFTEAGGTGTELFAGDAVSISQMIFIFSNSNGCSDESMFLVTINPSVCEDPMNNATMELALFFTPNGDGINDLWEIPYDVNLDNIVIYIYDRYGQLLQQIDTNATRGWDGTFQGKPMPATDYWYKYVNIDTGEISTGHFALKR